jgi:hypothetical protein
MAVLMAGKKAVMKVARRVVNWESSWVAKRAVVMVACLVEMTAVKLEMYLVAWKAVRWAEMKEYLTAVAMVAPMVASLDLTMVGSWEHQMVDYLAELLE